MGSWQEETVGGHPCDVFEPSEPNPHNHAVIYLHGVHLERLVDNQPFTDQFDRHGLVVVSPMTARSWWTDRVCEEFDDSLTAEHHVLENVLPYVQQRWKTGDRQVGLLGTSMGGQGALRISYKHPRIFPVVSAIAPAIDFHLRFDHGDETIPLMYSDKEAARQDTALLHIHPLDYPLHQFFCCDPTDENWFESVERLRMKLGSLGVPFEADLETEAGGHGFEYYNQMAQVAVDFLAERLEKERRRVP